MPEHEAPQSRNEAILQNILGEHNELLEPQSRNEAILQAILYGDSYTEDAQSRIETLLLCILNGTTTDLQPLSRNEEILIAKINGGTYDKEPQSRIEELLIEWLNAFVEKTVTGAVCSFDDAISGQPLIDLTAQIVPKQSGTGDPSPSNVRPISGWTGVNVTRCGKNLFDKTNTQDGFISGQTGEVMASTTRKCSDFIPVKPSTAYFMNGYGDLNYFSVVLFDENKAVIQNYYSGASKTAPFTFTTTATAKFARLTFIKEQLDTMSLTYGTTAPTTYEPYNGTTYSVSWQTEAGEIVEGTINIVSGLLTVEHMKQVYRGDDLDTLSLNYGQTASGYTHMYFGTNNTPLGKNYGQQLHTKSNIGVIANAQSASIPSSEGFAVLNLTNPDRLIVYWYVNLTWASANDFKTWLNNNPFELYYQLATPQTYQLTPTEVATILGINNIYSNTGNTTVKYKARG